MPVDESVRHTVAAKVHDLEAKRTAKVPLQTRHFVIERDGSSIRVSCRCGKVATLGTQNINVFVRRFNDFLIDHEFCESVGEPHEQ